MEQKRTPSWRAAVYHPPVDVGPSPDWQRIARAVTARDRYCQACRSPHSLTVHHIIPRKSGGLNDPGNLIVLCSRCHDEAECLGLLTFEGFYRWLNGHATTRDTEKVETKPLAPDDNWHRWVYGGYARPLRG